MWNNYLLVIIKSTKKVRENLKNSLLVNTKLTMEEVGNWVK